jgi:hypothetical protein
MRDVVEAGAEMKTTDLRDLCTEWGLADTCLHVNYLAINVNAFNNPAASSLLNVVSRKGRVD